MENIFKISTQRNICNNSQRCHSCSQREISRFVFRVLDGALNGLELSSIVVSWQLVLGNFAPLCWGKCRGM
jgi:hypothetical protein